LIPGVLVPKGVMVVQSSPAEGSEDKYNAWYKATHIPQILEIPGFVGARRYKVRDGGQTGGNPVSQYLTVYDLDADDLDGPLTELGARSAAGKIERSDYLQLTPPPVVTVYQLVE
jgi:hypothetical protein